MLYYNKITHDLQSEKPDKSFTDDYWQEVHGKTWAVVADDFVPSLTMEEVKHNKKVNLEAKYNPLYANIDRAFGAAMQLGNPTDSITKTKARIMSKHKAEKEAIDNG